MPEKKKPPGAESLRRKAAAERRKVREIDQLLVRLEARLEESAPAKKRARPGGGVRDDDRRTFPRQAADLVIRYRWPGRPAPLLGRVRDISRGGVRFSASRRLMPGLLLQCSMHAPGGPGPQAEGQMYLEVVHCRKSGELWEVGTRFSPTPLDKFKGTERRRARRHRVGLDLSYRLSGEEERPPRRGQVRDISRGGLRFYCDRRLRIGALAAVVVTGAGEGSTPGAGTRIRVSALMRVVRCRKVGSRYEIGVQFVG